MAQMSPERPVERTVQLITRPDDLMALHPLCYDPQRRSLRPNLAFVDPAGTIVFETNELGLAGGPLDTSRKLAIVWGDSVVLGSGRGWTSLLDALVPGYQFLNGGVMGDPFTNVLDRAVAFNEHHQVALNIVTTGWHRFHVNDLLKHERRWTVRLRRHFFDQSPLSADNADLRQALMSGLPRIPNTVLATMPTALNRRIVGQDLSSYMNGSEFRLLSGYQYSIAVQQALFEHIVQRNRIVRQVGGELGRPVVDLFRDLATEGCEDFRRDFFDVMHFRPTSFPLVAQHVYEGIKSMLV